MIKLYIILGFIFVLVVGLIKLVRSYIDLQSRFKFVAKYRANFIDFANKYNTKFNGYNYSGDFDHELYIWLTKNVGKIQDDLGYMGKMEYVGPGHSYKVSNYEIIINTIPKFKLGNIQNFDITYVDDALIRYIGFLENRIEIRKKYLWNPIIWFKEGFVGIISLPLLILNWFGIFSVNTVNRIIGNIFFKILTGIIGLVTLLSGIVTIIQGKEETLDWINKLFGN